MATVAELLVKISANSSGLRKELEASKRQLKRLDKDMPSIIPDNAGTIMAGFGTAIAVAAGKAVKLSAALEMNKISFETMLGSAQASDAMLNKLASLAAGSPFGFDELVESSKKMLGLGVAAQNVLPWLTTIGDTVSAFGGGTAQVQSISDAFAKMLAQGTMAADQMNRLSDAGVPGWQLLAEVLNVDVATAMKMAEQKSIDASVAIQGMMDIMTTRYAGSMQKASNTVTGQLSNMGDVATQIATKMGTSISKGLDLTNALGKANKQLDDFAQKIDSVGVAKALSDLIPDQVIVASMTAVAAYSAARFIPAMAAIRNAFLSARIAAIAFSASLGPLGWAVVGLTAVGTELYIQSQKTGNQLELLNDAIEQEANYMSDTSEEAEDLINKLREITGAAEMAENQLAKVAGMADFRRSEDTNAPPPIATTGAGSGVGGGAGAGGKSAWDELVDKAKQVTESIEREWVQTTVSQIGQLDIWRNEQLKALEETKDANENYERDKARVAATYSQRRIDIVKAEVEEIKRIQNQQDTVRQDVSSYGMSGSSAVLADIEAERQARIKAIRDAGLATIETNRLMEQVNQQTQAKIDSYFAAGLDLRDDLQAAYNAGDLAAYQQLLSDKNAAFIAQIEGEKDAMDAYYDISINAHRSAMSYMAEASRGFSSGMENIFEDIFNGTEKASSIFSKFGDLVLNTIAKIQAQKLAASLTSSLFGNLLGGSSGSNFKYQPTGVDVYGSTIRLDGALASGGPVSAGGSYLVGEKGPEIFIPRSAGSIMSNRDSMGMAAAVGGKPVTPNVHVNVTNNSGQQVQASQNASFDSETQTLFIDLIVEGVSRNVNGSRDNLAAALGV